MGGGAHPVFGQTQGNDPVTRFRGGMERGTVPQQQAAAITQDQAQ